MLSSWKLLSSTTYTSVRLAGDLVCQRISYVAGKAGVDSGVGQYVVCEHCGGGFAVAAGDTHHLGIGVSACEFYFADYRYVLCLCSSHDRSVERYAGLLRFRRRRVCVPSSAAFLEFDPLGFKHVAIAGAMFPLSLRKTSNPLSFASMAAPVPLSPAPSMTIFFLLIFCLIVYCLSDF